MIDIQSLITNLRTVSDKNILLAQIDTELKIDQITKKRLKAQLSTLNAVRITLAISPTQGVLDLIDAFLTKTFSKKTLMDIDVDGSIMGGARISYKGKYADFTLSEKI